MKNSFSIRGKVAERLKRKYDYVKKYIAVFHSAIVAFSGGVDSTFLAWISKEALGNNVLLVTADSPAYPSFECNDAAAFAKTLGASHLIIHSDETRSEGFCANTPQRCYYCKKDLFTRIKNIAGEKGFDAVFDGTNADDASDYRPGQKALDELGIESPLARAGFTKDDIRRLSANIGLPTANKPACACLASRFPYGETITEEKLKRVETAEESVRALGFTQFRIRSHCDCARIELSGGEMDRGWSLRAKLAECCRGAGFTFIALDCEGYRRGAMNEVLSERFI